MLCLIEPTYLEAVVGFSGGLYQFLGAKLSITAYILSFSVPTFCMVLSKSSIGGGTVILKKIFVRRVCFELVKYCNNLL